MGRLKKKDRDITNCKFGGMGFMEYKIGIVVVGYNRLGGIKRLVKSLEMARYDSNADLIFDIDNSGRTEIEQFAKQYEWQYGNKIVRTYPERQGLRGHMMKIGELFADYDALIVLEDDLIVSSAFYLYAEQNIKKYYNESKVFGISLRSRTSMWSNIQFLPVKNEFDNYFVQATETWGQVWLKRQWKEFEKWYSKHSNHLICGSNIPKEIATFPETAYSRYLTTYLVETDKYFSVPYIGYSSCFADAGEHTCYSGFNEHTMIQVGGYLNTQLSDFNEKAIRYDVFNNLINAKDWVKLPPEEVTIHLSDYEIIQHNRYLVTNQILDYKIIKSYGYALRPVELNLLYDHEGDDIFVYDTSCVTRNQVKKNKYREVIYKIGALSENRHILLILLWGKVKSIIKHKLCR